MKHYKLIAIVILLIHLIPTTIKAQKIDKNTKYIKYKVLTSQVDGKQKNSHELGLLVSSDSSKIYMFSVRPGYTRPDASLFGWNPYFHFEYSDSVSNTFRKVAKKFQEWRNIAKEHKSGKFEKKIDIQIPLKYVSQYMYGGPNFKYYEPDDNKFVFNYYNPDREPCLLLSNLLHINKYEVVYFSITMSVEDLENWANILEYKAIQKGLREESMDALFK